MKEVIVGYIVFTGLPTVQDQTQGVSSLKTNLDQLLNMVISLYCSSVLAVTMVKAHLLLSIWECDSRTLGIFRSF